MLVSHEAHHPKLPVDIISASQEDSNAMSNPASLPSEYTTLTLERFWNTTSSAMRLLVHGKSFVVTMYWTGTVSLAVK